MGVRVGECSYFQQIKNSTIKHGAQEAIGAIRPDVSYLSVNFSTVADATCAALCVLQPRSSVYLTLPRAGAAPTARCTARDRNNRFASAMEAEPGGFSRRPGYAANAIHVPSAPTQRFKY